MLTQNRELRIYSGPNPQQLHLVPNTGQWIHVSGPMFDGDIRVMLEQGVERIDDLPRKKFSIQTVGTYKAPPQLTGGRPLTFDDALFCVEFNRPVDWNALPIPAWLVKTFYRWLMRMNDDLVIRNIFGNHSPAAYDDQDMGWNTLFARDPFRDRPIIASPIVCSASAMNAIPDPNFQLAINSSPIPVPRDLQLICMPNRPYWTCGQSHQFADEVNEFNAFIFASAPVKMEDDGQDFDRTPDKRRLYLRKPQQPSTSQPMILPASEVRRQYPYNPNVKYAFEFFADYFDFNTFTLQPRLSRGSQPPWKAPSILGPFLRGRLQFDVTKHLRNQHLNPDGSISSEVIVGCKLKDTDLYFWCLKFEMVEY